MQTSLLSRGQSTTADLRPWLPHRGSCRGASHASAVTERGRRQGTPLSVSCADRQAWNVARFSRVRMLSPRLRRGRAKGRTRRGRLIAAPAERRRTIFTVGVDPRIDPNSRAAALPHTPANLRFFSAPVSSRQYFPRPQDSKMRPATASPFPPRAARMYSRLRSLERMTGRPLLQRPPRIS